MNVKENKAIFIPVTTIDPADKIASILLKLQTNNPLTTPHRQRQANLYRYKNWA